MTSVCLPSPQNILYYGSPCSQLLLVDVYDAARGSRTPGIEIQEQDNATPPVKEHEDKDSTDR